MSTQSSDRAIEVKEIVRGFILRSVPGGLDDDDDLFESGIVNSLFAVQLTIFVEKTFGVQVEMDDLDIENFKSLNAIGAFVLRKSAQAGV